MIALADIRSTTPQLPQASSVMLGGSGRIMQGAFGIVTKNLINLGAFAIEDLATSSKADLEGFDLPYNSNQDVLPSSLLQTKQQAGTEKEADDVKPVPSNPVVNQDEKDRTVSSSSMRFVGQLHTACQQTFGNHEPLSFEFIEEGGPDHKQCILTIKRPNGISRSYTSEANFKRKSDAKARVAAIAVEMGALDFILTGNKDNSKLSSLLAPVDNKVKQGDKEGEITVEDETSKEIQACCIEWRAGRVKPRWIFFSEHKGSPYAGCALVVELLSHLQRVYSVPPIYESYPEAKRQCSSLAVKQGVLDFIKYGNGQTSPEQAPDELLELSMGKDEAPTPTKKGREGAILLQSFFDTLPKPFPEPVGDKPASEINASGMLNNTLQLAKGAKLNIHFYFLNSGGLHGCILRLDRPEEIRTYLVEPKFAKRPDAKAAVCLLAMSQGVNQYIRDIAASIENKITNEMRKMANEVILPILGSEYAKLRHGMHPSYEFDHDQGAFGCTLVLTLPSESGEEDVTKRWTVLPEYRTKQDAKIAVVCKAGGEAIEFVRFKGQAPPLDHDPFKPYKRPKEVPQTPENGTVKREEGSQSPKSPSLSADRATVKRQTSTSGQVRLGLPVVEAREDDTPRQRGDGSKRPKRNPPQGKGRQAPFRNAPPVPIAPQNPYAHPYDISAAATAVIDRITGTPLPVHPSQHPPPPHHQPPPPPMTVPHMHSLQPPPPPHPAYAPYPSSAYPPDARPFPMMAAYPHHYPPPHVYQMPATAPPPVFAGIHDQYPPPHPAYYPDPRVPHYIPPPYHTVTAHQAPPYLYAQPPPTQSPYPDPAGMDIEPPQAPHPPDPHLRYSHDGAPPYRSTSFSTPKDRQKRPRSRERTPNDTQVMKKQRSESSLSVERSSRSRESPGWGDKWGSPTPPPPGSHSGWSSNESAVTALFDYCADERIARPEFSHKVVSKDGRDMFKVWVEHGQERLELPTLYHSVDDGEHRLAKQVLQRLKSQARSGD